MRTDVFEHKSEILIELISNGEENNICEFNQYKAVQARTFVSRGKTIPYYKIHCFDDSIKVQADYYIGADWILPGKKFVYVAPKINKTLIEKFRVETDNSDISDNLEEIEEIGYATQKLNYLKMFMTTATHPEVLQYTNDLLFIDWDAPEIPLEQNQDLLTPFLVVQYLNLLKQIVKKGLKKSYFKVQANLQSRVKGKILVSQNIKTNLLKNRHTNTVCEYQEFGVDSVENRFLKKVLQFIKEYIASHSSLFKGSESALSDIINYCNPAFEKVSDHSNDYDLKNIKASPFFKEYNQAIKIGQQILKRFAYNISTASEQQVTTPPFWIDMPRLFELYVYHQLLNLFDSKDVHYHFSTNGNELDFLITKEGHKMVIDAKYKLHYEKGHIHNDIRQVSGYARLKKVYSKLKVTDDSLIDCLIIYPDNKGNEEISLSLTGNKIEAYKGVYKLGLKLPYIKN